MSKCKMVPVEPTADMVIAGEDAWVAQLDKRLFAKENGEPFATYPSEETHELCSRVAYRAMLAAAPAVQEEPVAWATRLYNTAYCAGHHDTVEGCYTHVYPQDMDSYHEDVVQEWLADNPQPIEQQPADAVQGEPIPAGFALIKLDSRTGKPLVTSEMKVKHIGEYWWDEEAPYYDEHGVLHGYVARHAVPWSLCKEIYKSMASTAMLSVQPAEEQPDVDDSLSLVSDELFATEFNAWWEQQGQFCRAGGGDYERTFAFEAWRYLHPQLMKLQKVAAEQQPAPDVTQLVDALCRCLHQANYSIGCEDALKAQLEKVREIANDALSAYHKQGVEP